MNWVAIPARQLVILNQWQVDVGLSIRLFTLLFGVRKLISIIIVKIISDFVALKALLLIYGPREVLAFQTI